ncbi:MAG TPA: hypothetical protein VNZ63_09510 [Verrucomicrobiae bacterium]|nr:hypothetical protein [Verrucomicrobiae bacterium]
MKAGPPAAAFEGESKLIDGTGSDVGGLKEKLAAAEVDPSTEFETVMLTDPGKAVSAYVIAACSSVALTNVVGRGEPFQFTAVSLVKVVPLAGVTSRVKPVGLQYGVDAAGGELPSTETVPMLSPEIVNVVAAVAVVVPPHMIVADGVHGLGGGVDTVTATVPGDTRSPAETGTLSCVGLRYFVVVALDAPPHLIKEHGTKPVPVTIRVNGLDPTIALEGAIADAVGAGKEEGAVTEKFTELETAEPLEAVIAAVPDAGKSVSV